MLDNSEQSPLHISDTGMRIIDSVDKPSQLNPQHIVLDTSRVDANFSQISNDLPQPSSRSPPKKKMTRKEKEKADKRRQKEQIMQQTTKILEMIKGLNNPGFRSMNTSKHTTERGYKVPSFRQKRRSN